MNKLNFVSIAIIAAASSLCGFHEFAAAVGSPEHPALPAKEPASFFNSVQTYVNPVLPGDHPDPTLLKVGDDFYHCGSSFHFTPYLPVYHSRDLIHWEVISRVVQPSAAASIVADRPSAGIWQGAITYFYGSYWLYFSSGGQWFSKASSPYGPWSAPVRVLTNEATGNLGYDNSIFVDDDGKPYMVIKDGQKVNRIQALGHDGQLTDSVINLDWMNAHLQYSWAEGPVMCKRNGYYFYFPAGDVSGGQYVLRTKKLTSDSTCWERLGDFFQPVTDPAAGFRRPNHISAPIQLSDGSWWTLGQSYEKYGNDDWNGTGRQTSLYPVIWKGDRPWGLAPTTQPIIKPALTNAGIPWTSVQGDAFDSAVLGLQWHFLTRKAADNYSLTDRKGWIRLTPRNGRTHLVQKETDHYYTVVTKLDFNATDSADKAGIYLTNGNQHVVARLYSGNEGNKRIIFQLDTSIRSMAMANTDGNIVWLKLERKGHALSGYFSHDGERWLSLGAPISAVSLDRAQPNFNSWVGTSVGLFAEGKPADFDAFTCKDAFSPLTAAGYSNYYGVKTLAAMDGDKTDGDKLVTNTSRAGGWLMISGVETGSQTAGSIQLTASARTAGKLEIWLDDLQKGTLIATIPVTATGGLNAWKTFSRQLKPFGGHHDVFIKYPAGEQGAINIRTIQFIKASPLSKPTGAAQDLQEATGTPSLKEAFKRAFLIGAALNTAQVEERDPAVSELIARQFNAMTPENDMKAALIHPGWDRYDFKRADEIVLFAEKYHIKVNAHNLIWHSQLPSFVMQMKDADSVRRFFTDHIKTVAGRYDGKVYSWDVVNEALNEDGTLRKSIFEQKLGDDYVVEAFRLAQQAAPHTLLYYNDYNIEHGLKRAGAIALIRKIQAAGVRIDGVGIQGHWSTSYVPLEDIENSIREFSALGIKVMFTELDLSVLPNPRSHHTADVGQRATYADSLNPYVSGLPDSAQALLANSYAKLFQLFLKYKEKISRVTFWGVDDGQTWLNDFPVRGRTNYPLLFDRQLKPKPAFFSVIATSTGH